MSRPKFVVDSPRGSFAWARSLGEAAALADGVKGAIVRRSSDGSELDVQDFLDSGVKDRWLRDGLTGVGRPIPHEGRVQ